MVKKIKKVLMWPVYRLAELAVLLHFGIAVKVGDRAQVEPATVIVGMPYQKILILEVEAETYRLMDIASGRILIQTALTQIGSGEVYTVSQEIFKVGSGVAEINELVADIRKGAVR